MPTLPPDTGGPRVGAREPGGIGHHADLGERSRQMLRRLRDVMSEAGAAQDRLDQIVSIIAADMVAEVCSIYVRRSDNLLELCATQGLNPDAVHRTRLAVGEGLVGDIAEHARPLALSDAQSHPKFAYRPETGEEIYQSLMGVPVQRAQRVLGVLLVQNRRRRQYADEEIETLETFAMVLVELIAQVLADSEAGGVRRVPARYAGHGLVPGLAIGHAYLHQRNIVVRRVVAEDPLQEAARLEQALATVQAHLDGMLASPDIVEDSEHQEVLQAFRMFARDRGWLARMREAISGGLTAEAAVQHALNDMRGRLGAVADPYLRERIADFEDLANRLLQQLNQDEDPDRGNGGRPPPPHDAVIFARTMGPADLLDYDRTRLRAVVLEQGSATAHVAIVARALDIPVIGRATGALSDVEDGDTVIVDGDNDQVFLRPGDEVLTQVQRSLETRTALKLRHRQLRDLPARSRDGVDVTLLINASLLVDMPQLEATGAAGVGLYRTEIPFMVRRDYPDVAVQTALYRRVMDGADGRPVVFRTLDIGADKRIPSFQPQEEENPAMGWRALRILIDQPSLLRHQIRALLRAADGRPLDVMFAMVSDAAEITIARGIIDLELERAAAAGVALPERLSIGAMIEVPALLWQLPELLGCVDFLSVGSNDLAQYMFAADRNNERLSGRYDPLSPPFLRVLRQIAVACGEAGVPVTVCGEMAGRPLDTMALLGLGYRRLSMAPASIGPIKETIRNVDVAGLEDLVSMMIETNAKGIRSRFRAYARDHAGIS
jgi:phosphotransferase system, enzyme I, PtsP